jgi:hypothetical protein
VLGIVVIDGAWVGNLLELGTGDEETNGTTEGEREPPPLGLAGSIDGGLDEDGATENVGLFVGNLVLVGACEELGDGEPTGGRVGAKVTFKDGCGVTVGTIVTFGDIVSFAGGSVGLTVVFKEGCGVAVGTTETLGSIVSFDGGSVGLPVTFRDGCGVAVGTIVIVGAIVPFEGVLTGGRVGLGVSAPETFNDG